MAFESLAEFFYMGGHGIYVWPAFIISISLLKILLWKPLRAQRLLLDEVKQQAIREQNPHSPEVI